MRPDYALFALENLAGAVAVPRIYAALPRPVLEALARECAAGTPDQQVPPGWTRDRLGPPAAPPDDAVTAIEAAVSAPPPPDEPGHPVGRAVAHPRRLRTMARRRAAFLYYLERCPTVTEAAQRTGIDRRTAQRWYERDAAFAARWDKVVARRRKLAVEDVVLGAGHAEVREVWFRGRKVGEYTRRDRALQLYLLKQHDAAEARAGRQRLFDDQEGGSGDYEDGYGDDYGDEHGDDDFDYEGELEAAAISRSEMPRSLRLFASAESNDNASDSKGLPDGECDSGFAR